MTATERLCAIRQILCSRPAGLTQLDVRRVTRLLSAVIPDVAACEGLIGDLAAEAMEADESLMRPRLRVIEGGKMADRL